MSTATKAAPTPATNTAKLDAALKRLDDLKTELGTLADSIAGAQAAIDGKVAQDACGGQPYTVDASMADEAALSELQQAHGLTTRKIEAIESTLPELRAACVSELQAPTLDSLRALRSSAAASLDSALASFNAFVGYLIELQAQQAEYDRLKREFAKPHIEAHGPGVTPPAVPDCARPRIVADAVLHVAISRLQALRGGMAGRFTIENADF